MVFEGYSATSPNGEYWVTREAFEKFSRKRRADALSFLHRRKSDPLFKAARVARDSSKRAVRLITKKTAERVTKPRSFELLGTDVESFKAHIESQFAEGMSWENHGEWHIDHIVPLASGKTPEDIWKLCHYTNLQPLWAADNIRKGARQ
jgi:hypothetical protein